MENWRKFIKEEETQFPPMRMRADWPEDEPEPENNVPDNNCRPTADELKKMGVKEFYKMREGEEVLYWVPQHRCWSKTEGFLDGKKWNNPDAQCHPCRGIG